MQSPHRLFHFLKRKEHEQHQQNIFSICLWTNSYTSPHLLNRKHQFQWDTPSLTGILARKDIKEWQLDNIYLSFFFFRWKIDEKTKTKVKEVRQKESHPLWKSIPFLPLWTMHYGIAVPSIKIELTPIHEIKLVAFISEAEERG